jgi:Glycosyltransferase family 87
MPSTKFTATELLLIFSCSAAFGAIYALHAGQDINWDWQNYHEYSVWAWLHSREDQDVAPPGVSGFFNPLVYFPHYFLRHFLPDPYGAMVLGAIQGFAFGCIWLLARTLIGSTVPSRFGTAFALAALIMALCSPLALSEIGTSFADGLTAIPALLGLLLLLGARPSNVLRYFLGGTLIGLAVGLKLTNAIFAIAATVAAVGVAHKPFQSAFGVSAGVGAGALATGGSWAYHLYRTYGSPLYPFYNAIFKSPEALPTNFSDARFFPRGVIHGVAYPFLWLLGKHPSAEVPFRDSRFAVFFLGCAALIGVSLWRRRLPLARSDSQFLIFLLLAFLLWMLAFSIQRYAITLELATSAAIVLIIARCLPHRLAAPFAIVLALAMSMWSRPADWGRRPWSDPFHKPEIPTNLQAPATYLIVDKPVALVALYLPPKSRFYQLEDANFMVLPDHKFDRMIRRGLDTPLSGGVWAMRLKRQTPTPFPTALLDAYGQLLDASRPCEVIDLPRPVEVCPLMISHKATRAGLSGSSKEKG